MSSTLFISDLHLHRSRPCVTAFFQQFLETTARRAEQLYILGDLFEAWIGDDDTDSHNRGVMAALRSYTASGCACFFARGNRDFLIGAEFCAATGVRLLDEPAIVDMAGESVLVLHGDVLCTDDAAYQAFRRRVRNPRLQALFLTLPLAVRGLIAGRLRRRSQILSAGRHDYITDVNSQAVAAIMRAHGVRMMLHGHTHRPAVHQFELDGTPATRIVLGDWYTQGSVLHWSGEGYELRPLAFRN